MGLGGGFTSVLEPGSALPAGGCNDTGESSLTHALSLTLSASLALPHIHYLSPLSLSHTHTPSLSLSHTHTTSLSLSPPSQVHYQDAAYIVHQGELGSEFFIMQSGTALCTVSKAASGEGESREVRDGLSAATGRV